MNDILKQRLVGALILVALGVVFWPIIFVQPDERGTTERPGIPPRPAVDSSAIEPPDMAGLRPSRELSAREEQLEPEPETEPETALPEPPPEPELEEPETKQPTVVAAKPAPAPEEPARPAATRTEAPVKPKIDKDGVPIAWILQVASVSSPEKADELRRSLLEMDQKAYVKKIKRNGRALYRVYIGPKYEKAKLAPVKTRVDSAFGVQSMIVRYYP